MAVSTYSELQSAVADYLHRTDLTTQIQTFIALAEAEFNRVLRITGQVTNTTLSVSGNPTTLPTDWLSNKSVLVYAGGQWRQVDPQSEETIRSYNAGGYPKHYAISGTNILFAPSPDGTYSVSLTYYAQIPALSNTTTTNHLLTSAPELYLWRAIYEGAKWMRDMDLATMAQGEYVRYLTDVMTRDQDRQYGPGTVMRAA